MSRSIKGSKGCGYDYWGKRALSGCCGYGKAVKVETHRKERRRANAAVRDGRHEMLASREAI
jgi:AMMECR1 domain-containing protein